MPRKGDYSGAKWKRAHPERAREYARRSNEKRRAGGYLTRAGRITGLRRVELADGGAARYRPVGYRDSDGRFHVRTPSNGHWRTAKGRARGQAPTPAELEASDVVNWEVHYNDQVLFFASEGGVPWAGLQ